MKVFHSISMGAWLLIALNLLMSFGAIGIFMRMAPAIERIIERNERSLQSCEEMLTYLAYSTNSTTDDTSERQTNFLNSLHRARNNVTEAGELQAINDIETHYIKAFRGDHERRNATIVAIQHLSQLNRQAMVEADRKARQLGNAGAWGIVFMASMAFIAGLCFVRSLRRNVVEPLDEIQQVIEAANHGDLMRRCSMPNPPQTIRHIFKGINDILDRK